MSVLFANTSIFDSQWLHLPLSELALCVQMSVWVMCHWVRVESLLYSVYDAPPSQHKWYICIVSRCLQRTELLITKKHLFQSQYVLVVHSMEVHSIV